MSELTYEEKLKLDNSKEHLKVVLDNVRIESEKLSGVFEDLAKTKLELANIVKLKDEIIFQNLSAKSDIDEIKASQDRREESLLERENKLKEDDEKIQLKIFEANKVLEDIENKSRISLSNYLKTIDAQNIVLIDYQNNIENLQEKISQYEKTIKEQFEFKTKQENEILGLNKQNEEVQKELKKFQEESFKEMKETIILIDKEKDKIK